MKRRDAIKALGAIAGVANLPRLLAGCGSDGPGSIDTYVFLMMENRTYDHYLGARSMLEGLPGDGLTEGMSNPDLLGNAVPIWPGTDENMCVIDPPHGWDASRAQFADGANDGFVTVHQTSHGDDTAIEPMQYMRRQHQPITNALADAYVSCDRWFASVLGGTLPNRMYWHAGTSNGARTNNEVLGGAFQGIQTLYHLLDAAGIDWVYYYGDVPVLAALQGISLTGRLRSFNASFFADAEAGRLPPVVYIDPAFGANDDHPPHHPLLGQQLIAAVYDALATSPHWERSMLVVTYDEHGGFYDHVPPPTAPDEHASEGFDQLGFRVPGLVAGPYVKQGVVSSVQYDHTSPLKHLSNVFELEPITQRWAAANDLADAIDLERLAAGRPAPPIALPPVVLDESMLPESCFHDYGSFLLRREPIHSHAFDHDILAWADANPHLFGELDLRGQTREYVFGIADYLERRGLGHIRRGY
jgi:phospholipase C